MKIPENFRKLVHQKALTINGTKFYLDCCAQKEGSVWLFENDSNVNNALLKGTTLYFMFDWKNQFYDVRKCILGEGTTGTDIAKNCIFDKREVQSLERFITMLIQHTTKILRVI
jgi:hypothetical protein